MFEKYNPLKKKQFRLINHLGKLINKREFEDETDAILDEGLKRMLLARTVDLRAVSSSDRGGCTLIPQTSARKL